jgi:hypothetical protein
LTQLTLFLFLTGKPSGTILRTAVMDAVNGLDVEMDFEVCDEDNAFSLFLFILFPSFFWFLLKMCLACWLE